MKGITIGSWSLIKPINGFGYNIYKRVKIESKTGTKKEVDKIIGYNVPLKDAIFIIAEDQSIPESNLLIDYLKNIEDKIDNIKVSIIEQIIYNLK